MLEVIERAVESVSTRFQWDAEDLYQEACIFVADRNRNLYERACLGDYGNLRYWLEQDLRDLIQTPLGHRNEQVSYDERYETDQHLTAPEAPSAVSGGYDRELVQRLLPAVWDAMYCYGMQAENAPDADMPRVASSKATGGTLAAHLADIRAGWRKAPLTKRERQCLFLTYGLDCTQRNSAQMLDVDQRTVGRNAESGVGKIVAHLNGDTRLADWLAVTSEEIDDVLGGEA